VRKLSMALNIIMICCLTVAVLLYISITCSIHGGSSHCSYWETCTVNLYTLTPIFTFPYRHVSSTQLKVYVADSPEKLYEGYRFKDSYDFLNKGAKGMLLDVRQYAGLAITITMQNVKLPLSILILEKFGSVYKIVNWRELHPGEDWLIQLPDNSPLILELDPGIGRQILNNANSTLVTVVNGS